MFEAWMQEIMDKVGEDAAPTMYLRKLVLADGNKIDQQLWRGNKGEFWAKIPEYNYKPDISVPIIDSSTAAVPGLITKQVELISMPDDTAMLDKLLEFEINLGAIGTVIGTTRSTNLRIKFSNNIIELPINNVRVI